MAAKPLGQRGETQKELQRDGYSLVRVMTARWCTQGPDLVHVLPAQTSGQVTIIRQLCKTTQNQLPAITCSLTFTSGTDLQIWRVLNVTKLEY